MPESMNANPYAEDLGSRDPIEVMSKSPARFAELLNQFPAEQIEAKPAPDKWSIREVMCHMADCEVAWSWRLRLILEQYHPQLQPFDQDAWAKVYSKYKLQQARMTFDALRVWNLQFLSALTEDDRKRPARHPERGELTLWNIVETIAGHDLHHINTLEKLPKQS